MCNCKDSAPKLRILLSADPKVAGIFYQQWLMSASDKVNGAVAVWENLSAPLVSPRPAHHGGFRLIPTPIEKGLQGVEGNCAHNESQLCAQREPIVRTTGDNCAHNERQLCAQRKTIVRTTEDNCAHNGRRLCYAIRNVVSMKSVDSTRRRVQGLANPEIMLYIRG